MPRQSRLYAGAILGATALALAAAPAGAVTVKTIAGTPMTLYVGDQGQIQGNRAGDPSNIFFAPTSPVGDAGFFLAFPNVSAAGGAPAQLASLAGSVYGFTSSGAGPSTSDTFTPVSQADPTGTGTAADPFKQVTTYLVNAAPTGDVARVVQTTSYINGSQTFDLRWDVTNLQATALRFKALTAADFYFEGSDVGTGVFTAGPPRFVGGTNADTGRSGGFIEALAPSTSPPWSHYQALPWGLTDKGHGLVWERVKAAADTATGTLDDSVVGEPVDNAGAVEWDQYVEPATTLAQSLTVTFALSVRTAAPAALQFDQTNAGAPQGVPVTITATAKDTADAPFINKPLRWQITGANNLSGAVLIDAQGHAPITDPGTNAGPDTIVAYVDLNNNSIREPNEPQASALVTFVDNIPPACVVSVSGDRSGLGGGAGRPLIITVSCNSAATVTAVSSLSITRPTARASAAAKKKPKKAKKKAKPIVVKLPVATTTVLPGQSVPVNVRIPASVIAKYPGAKVTATVVTTATDAAGNASTVTTRKTTTLAKPKPKKKKAKKRR